MNILYTPHHQQHHPEYELFNGERTPHSEIPDRVENILTVLRQTEHQLLAVDTIDAEAQRALDTILSTIHDQEYLDWFRQTVVTEDIYPSVFNYLGSVLLSGHQSVQWGNFVTDTFTPLLPHTFQAAYSMAQAVFTGAQRVIAGEEVVAVIGRPPGHHAGKRRVGGYCYLNNAAVGAQMLANLGRVAILDVDYHHGNGTQDIFYDRSDVVTCSIHADPVRKFPYFAGFVDERGISEGKGYNQNYPLKAGITNEEYQTTLETALTWLQSHRPEYLVISLGLDTHESDPIADFKLTTDYYERMANTIAQLNVPTLIVLEGGYNTGVLGENVQSFLSGF